MAGHISACCWCLLEGHEEPVVAAVPPDMMGAGQGKERAAGGEWGEEGKRLTAPPPATPAGL